MIKLIVFDLDGVLVDSRDMHYEALNRALKEVSPSHIINKDKHLSTFDGLPTSKKLQLLTDTENLDPSLHTKIWQKKQEYTSQIIDKEYTYDERIRAVLAELKRKGYIIYIASNCIYKSMQMILLRKGFMEYVDYFISNADVVHPKPSPEIYFRCMTRANVSCYETLIVEDSHIGRTAALNSGANILAVENTSDVTLESIMKNIENKYQPHRAPKWQGECNIVIPMAGAGSRFAKAGYSFPKPLINVHGKPMIQVVVENLCMDTSKCRFIFICRDEQVKKYNLNYLLKAIAPNSEIIIIDKLTEGAACSILLAKKYINNDKHLLLANSDQFMEWDANRFMYTMIADDIDGGIATFQNTHPKWSYAKLDDNGYVCEVAEKKPISTNATTGIYYWKKGNEFVKYAEQMIAKNIRINNEFYTAPVFNEAIADKKKVKIFPIKKMWGIGVPEDLNYFLQNYTGKI